MKGLAYGPMRLERTVFLTVGLLGTGILGPVVAFEDVRLGWLIFSVCGVLLGLGLFLDLDE